LGEARSALLAAGTDTAEKCWRLAEVERWLGHEQEAVRRLARARELAVGDPHVRVKVEIELMLIHEWNLRHGLAHEAASAASVAAVESGDAVLLAEVQGVMATTLVQTDPQAALEPYALACEAVEGYDDQAFPAHPMSLWDLGWAATYLERYDEAIGHFDRGLRIARARGAHGNAAMFLADRAEPRFRAGRLASARECAEEAVEAARAGASPRFLWWALARLGLVLGRLGDAPRAEEVMHECAEAARSLPPSPLVSLWTAHGLAAAAVAVGDFARAAALLTEAGGAELERFAPIDRTRPRLNVLEAALRAGRHEHAERWAAEAEAWAAHCGLEAQRGWALIARALVAAATELPVAVTAAAEAAEAFARAGAALEAERARTLEGRLLAEAGDRSGALAALELAEERLHALGAEADRAAAARELRKLGRRAPRRDAAHGGPVALDGRLAALSRREREVAELVAGGATNQAIADALYLSVKTVESHLRNIFAKAGVGSREALAAAVNREARSDGAA
jgi:ATP/maltotriose-dependent transcriptional regulator MalT